MVSNLPGRTRQTLGSAAPAGRWPEPGGRRDNGVVRGQSLAGLLAMVLTTTVVACTGAPSTAPGTRPHETRPPAVQPGAQVLGAPGCRPASPVTRWHSFLPQVEGTAHGVTLWGLLMFPHPLPARV